MLVDYESAKPLRPKVKANRSLRKDEQEEKHPQANVVEHDHFGFSIPRNLGSTQLSGTTGFQTLPAFRHYRLSDTTGYRRSAI
jgi:hypothetical protein